MNNIEKELLWKEYVEQGYQARIGKSVISHNEVTDWDGKTHYCRTIGNAFKLFCKINDR